MSTVKTIDVAIRASTEAFERGMGRSAASTKQLDAAASSLAKKLGEAAVDFQQGVITAAEYTSRMDFLTRELEAVGAGFRSLKEAQSAADKWLRVLESSTERYQRELTELNSLLKMGALTQAQYGNASAELTRRFSAAGSSAASMRTQLAAAQSSFATGGVRGFTDKLGSLSIAASGLTSQVPAIGMLTSSLSGLASVGGPLAVAAAAVTGFGLAIRNAMKETDRVSDISLELGIDSTELLALEFAARKTGVEVGLLQSGLQRLTIASAAAASGNKQMGKVFAALGLDAQKMAELTPDQQFRNVAEAMAAIEAPSERARLAVKLFGREGISLVRVMALGADGLDKVRERSIALGNALTTNGVSSVDAWKSATAELGTAWDGFSQLLLNIASPAVRGLAVVLEKSTTVAMFAAKLLSGDAYGASIAAGWEEGAKRVEVASARITKSAQSVAAAQMQADKEKGMWDAMSKGRTDIFGEGFKAHMQGVNSDLERFNKLLEKANTPQQQFLADIEKINQLQSMGLIDLEKRNALLASITKTAMQPQADAMAKAAEEMAKRQEALRTRGEAISKSVETPFEAFTQKIAELDKLRRAGAIDTDTFQRAFAAARNEFGATLEKTASTVFDAVQPPAAVERGTQEAFSAFQRNRDAKTKDDKQLEEARKSRVALETLVKRGVILAKAMI